MGPVSAEAEAFIRRSKVALVATRSARSRPFITPLWFVLDGGALYITTGTGSWVGRNIARNPSVVMLFGVERGTRCGRMLRLRGQAACHEGLPPRRVLARIAAKYYLAPRGLMAELRHIRQWRLRMRYYAAAPGGTGYLKVIPDAAELLDPA